MRIVLLVALLCVLNATTALPGDKWRALRHRGKNVRRLLIIRCCGGNSCHNVSKITSYTKKTSRQYTAVKKKNASITSTLQTSLSIQSGSHETHVTVANGGQQIIQSDDSNASTQLDESSDAFISTALEETISTIGASANTINAVSDKTAIHAVPFSATLSSTLKIETPSAQIETTSSALTPTPLTTSTLTFTSDSTSSTSTTTSTSSTTTSTTPCPLHAKDILLLDANGTVKDPTRYGNWMNFCNKTYLFGNRPLNWTESNKLCQALDMSPISLATERESNCFQSSLRMWKLNLNYWTAGKNTSDGPVWCSSNQSISDASSSIIGYKNSTYGDKNCIQLRITKRLGPNGYKFFSFQHELKTCTSKSIFACEKNTQLAILPVTNVNDKPTLTSRTCLPGCSRNSSLFDEIYKFLIHPWQYGFLTQQCNVSYLFVNALNLTWNEAKCYCEKRSMRISSVESAKKLTCLQNINKQNYALQGPYWTSGIDLKSDGNFEWCTTNEKMTVNAFWAQGMPATPTTTQGSCVQVNLQDGTAQLQNSLCSNTLPFICETPDPKKNSPGELQMKECQKLFNVTDDLLKKLWSLTLDRNIKCFMKCLGEYRGLLFNGAADKMVFLSLIEAVSTTEEKFDKNIDTMDSCNTIADPDACELIANRAKCVNDKDPELMQEIIRYEDTNYPDPGPFSCIGPTCPKPPTCTLNTTVINMIAADTVPPLFTMVKACGITYLLSEFRVSSLQDAWKQCCSLNMNPLQLETKAEYECLRQAHNNYYVTNPPINASALVKYYYTGLVNYGCPEVFGWCPSLAPFLLKYYTFNPMSLVGIMVTDRFGEVKEAFLTRNDTQLLAFACESK